MSSIKLFVECDTDVFLAETIVLSLGLTKRIVKHAGNRGKVVSAVMSAPVAFGIIDEDLQSAGQPSNLKRFKKKDTATGLQLLEHSRQKQILVIQPRIEEWFLHLASRCGISPTQFRLSSRAEDLHRIRIFRNKGYQDFVRALCQQCDELKKASSWVGSFVKRNSANSK